MLKGALRYVLTWGLSLVLTPYVHRAFDEVATRAPKGSFLEEVLLELSDKYSAGLVQACGETAGELVLGSK